MKVDGKHTLAGVVSGGAKTEGGCGKVRGEAGGRIMSCCV